jgi:hypothetical protein
MNFLTIRERKVSTGFTNPVQGASKLPLTKIKALTRSLGFAYRFWRVQALPLIQLRFLCPRNGRGLDAKYPRHSPPAVRGLVQSATPSGTQTVHDRVREQSVSASSPQPRGIRQMSASRFHRVRAMDDSFPDIIRVSPHLLQTMSFALLINFHVTAQRPA